MTDVLIKPAGTTLGVEPRVVDLSAASIEETLATVTTSSGETLNEQKLRRVEFIAQFLPADTFTPVKMEIPSGPGEEDKFFELLREINKINEMMGGNGIDIETLE